MDKVTKRRLDALTKKAGQRRDDIRKLLDEFEPILDTLRDADEAFEVALSHLQQAREAVDDAAESISQYA